MKRVDKLQEIGRVLNDEKEIEDAFVSHQNMFESKPLFEYPDAGVSLVRSTTT